MIGLKWQKKQYNLVHSIETQGAYRTVTTYRSATQPQILIKDFNYKPTSLTRCFLVLSLVAVLSLFVVGLQGLAPAVPGPAQSPVEGTGGRSLAGADNRL